MGKEGTPMGQPWTAERWLVLLLRLVGGVCLIALVPLLMPRSWIEAGHAWLDLGAFPAAPIAEYLARSVSSLSAFYGGLLVALDRKSTRLNSSHQIISYAGFCFKKKKT